MYEALLIETGTIQTLTPTNNGGDISTTSAALYTNIPMRINDLSGRDMRFLEGKEQYTNVSKKAFIEGSRNGVLVGMALVSGGKTYKIEFVKTLKDAVAIQHFELFLSIVE